MLARVGSVALVLIITLGAAACARSDGNGKPSPSGELGVVTQEDAQAAVDGLCRMHGLQPDQLDAANGVFYDRVHEELHVIAAATQKDDRVASAHLLVAKERMEDDLRSKGVLPESYGADVDALTRATLAALRAVDLPVKGCG